MTSSDDSENQSPREFHREGPGPEREIENVIDLGDHFVSNVDIDDNLRVVLEIELVGSPATTTVEFELNDATAMRLHDKIEEAFELDYEL